MASFSFPPGTKLIRLSSEKNILPFDCGDTDLNEFLVNDSKNYLQQLLAVTYLIETETETIAFFSVSNDKISYQDLESNNQFKKKFKNYFPKGKQFKSYPAVKIGRLGVSNKYQNKGLGTILLNYIKQYFVDNNKTGCKYITVDAYQQSLRYYQKNGFEYMTSQDEGKDTRLMYFSLLPLV